MLFDLATARLAERKVLLPGVTTLAREVARVRDRVNRRPWVAIAGAPDAAQRERLLALLQVPEDARFSELDRLRRGPTSVAAAGLVGALERLDGVRALDAGGIDVSPASRCHGASTSRCGGDASNRSSREDRRARPRADT